MADGNALYGVIGVVAGAFVTGVAGVFGPLRLQRRNAEQQYATDRRTSDDAQVLRLIELRTKVRAWHTALQDIAQELTLRRAVNLERFEDLVHGRRDDASAAIDAGITGNVYFHQDNSTGGYGQWVDDRTRGHFDDATRERYVLVLDGLEAATRLTRGLVIKGAPLGADDRAALESASNEVSRARDQLAAVLLDRISEITGRPVRRV